MKHIVCRNHEEELVTIYDAFQSFIEDKQAHNLAKTSIIAYEDSFRYFMNYFQFDENTPMHEVNSHMFTRWTIDKLIIKGSKSVGQLKSRTESIWTLFCFSLSS